MPRRALLATALLLLPPRADAAFADPKAASGARVWVDPKTPGEAFAYTSSRGDKWELVMSDEFDTPGRKFSPGEDHLWTAIAAPDSVSKALGYYAPELATTECQGDVVCYLKLNAITTPRSVAVYNPYANPPGVQNQTFFYQSAMLQSWNKFCFQGGMVEVRAKLPGAVEAASQNPDLANGAAARVRTVAFYPTWPGVWLMGNLGRALFSETTKKMWPYSYDACEPSVFDPKNQRISACNDTPGSGMNAKQGRGAPQIDLLQGGGLDLISSLQVGPGMPTNFRRIAGESTDCIYGSNCQTLGANIVGVPTETYASRGHKSWYQGLRYASNPFCAKNETEGGQSVASVQASLSAGITANTCSVKTCPASFDVNSDLGVISGSTTVNKNWGVNVDGSCFAEMSAYNGALLCGPGNTDADCVKLAGGATSPTLVAGGDSFKYYADSLSASWPIHLAMYTDFLAYQVEWVPGKNGYIRWMLERQPIFEIPAEALTSPPQDSGKTNPTKILPEEPMYLIMNVALSSSWSAQPPNAGRACNDNRNPETAAVNNLICSQFPMSLKIDYVRVYQDLSAASTMNVGCDPASHPTRQWIKDHQKDYQDTSNPIVAVHGKAFCLSNADCTGSTGNSGSCVNSRCSCRSNWSGPRCVSTKSVDDGGSALDPQVIDNPFGTASLGKFFSIALAALFALMIVLFLIRKIRMWLYYRTHVNMDHVIVNRDNNRDSLRDSGLGSQSRWWLRPESGGTPADFGAHNTMRNQRNGGLAPIPETPPGLHGNAAASAA